MNYTDCNCVKTDALSPMYWFWVILSSIVAVYVSYFCINKIDIVRIMSTHNNTKRIHTLNFIVLCQVISEIALNSHIIIDTGCKVLITVLRLVFSSYRKFFKSHCYSNFRNCLFQFHNISLSLNIVFPKPPLCSSYL